MKVDSINFPDTVCSEFGLEPVKMDRLNNIIVIAGKNGAGKTRFFELLQTSLINYPNDELYKRLILDFDIAEKAILNTEIRIAQLKKEIQNHYLDKEKNQLNTNISNLETNLERSKKNISHLKNKLDLVKNITISPTKIDNSIIQFVPKSLHLRDSYNTPPSQLDDYAKFIYLNGTSSISEGTIPAIEKIQKKWVNASVPDNDLNATEEEIKIIKEDYQKLKNYIKIFLNTDLKRNSDGYPEIFGRRIGEAKLSDGQKILLQFCLALYGQESTLENIILFMDEPENHLHPAALIEVLDKIIPQVQKGQLWISTHSINVIAHFDPSSIWYIEEGKISYAGNIPQKVLSGLLGSDEEIEKLSNFLSLPAQMASTNFAFESLFYPKVVLTGADDPQVKQIHEIISTMKNEGKMLKILDFGMGKGRLLSTIYENERLNGKNVADWLDFYGYDSNTENKDTCENIFQEVYGSSKDRYFNHPKDILVKYDEESFDVIVMCNVFHEIDPKEWLNVFNSATSLFKLLHKDGYLLIVEDQLLAVGEKAHSKGFLVLDSLEFKTLFKIQEVDNYHVSDYRKDGRLKAHHIPKSVLTRIDTDSRKKAIEILNQNSKDSIKQIRKEPSSFKNGKLHGFWAQQLANSSLSLEEL